MSISASLKWSSANAFNLVWSKILSFGKELKPLPDDNILVLAKLKALADDKININENI